MQDPRAAAPEPAHGLRRAAYVLLGLFFVGLAVLGAVLPVLPTTPFLLLASYFLVRSSPALNGWLLRSRLFGGLLRDWQRHRAVRPRVKFTALAVIPLAAGASAYFGGLPWYLLALLGVLAAVGVGVVVRLPVLREGPPAWPAGGAAAREGGGPP